MAVAAKIQRLADPAVNSRHTLNVRVSAITPYGENIRCFEVVDPNGRPLPGWGRAAT